MNLLDTTHNNQQDRLMQPHMLVRRTIALVLAGGRGSRLKQLTDRRAKPAVYFGGKFRIIDFALSNCVNSGIRRIGVITQYKSHSLLRHLQRGWSFLRAELNEMVDLLPAQQRLDEELKKKLAAEHDEFLPGEKYIRKWNYQVDRSGTIPE